MEQLFQLQLIKQLSATSFSITFSIVLSNYFVNGWFWHVQIKMKKYKTSENEQSHGSFFLRIGGLGKDDTSYH